MSDPTVPPDKDQGDHKPQPSDRPKETTTPGDADRRDRPDVASVDTAIPWGLIFFLILSVLMAVFAVQNTQDVELEFLGWSGEFPLIMIIVGVFVAAVILDEILGAVLRRRRRTRKLEKQELERLRKLK